MQTQLIIIGITLLVFAGLGYMMSRSIKKYETNKSRLPKKRGRNKYMPEAKKFGK